MRDDAVVLRARSRTHSTVSRPYGARPLVANGEAVSSRHQAILDLQSSAGNHAVQRALVGSVVRWPLPAGARAVAALPADARFRSPKFIELERVYKSATLAVPEAVIKNRLTIVFARMARENRLKVKRDPKVKDKANESWKLAKEAVAQVFPGGGKIDQAAFEAVLDSGSRTAVYETVVDAESKVKAADVAKLKKAFGDAAGVVDKVQKDAKGLKAVFGSKRADARTNYGLAATALRDTAAKLGTRVTTDYNRDDPEVGLGGWASFSGRHMHLTLDVVKVVDKAETKTTLIHEAAHLAEASIDDHGYYGSANFEALSEDIKVANAAHYEELPRRQLGTSRYAGVTFKPGLSKSGSAPTFEDNVHRRAGQQARKAWDRAVDVFAFLRDVRKAALGGDKSEFASHRAKILAMSRKMGLTVHEQKPSKAEVTQLDIVLAEGVARAMTAVGQLARRQSVPLVLADEAAATDWVLTTALSEYGTILNDPTKDRALLDWLAAGYRSSIP